MEPEKPVAAPAPIINEVEARKREAEAKRQAELAARQLADAQSKTKRVTKKKEDEAAAAEAVTPAAPPAVEAEPPKKKRVIRKKGEEPATEAEAPVLVEVKAEAGKAEAKPAAAPAPEGTLHRPVLKPGEKDAKDKKGPKRAARPASAWVDDVARRRAMKTRGDTSGGRDGWRSRGASRHRDAEEGGTAFAAPSEPKVIEVLVPETISVGDLAQDVRSGEVIKAM